MPGQIGQLDRQDDWTNWTKWTPGQTAQLDGLSAWTTGHIGRENNPMQYKLTTGHKDTKGGPHAGNIKKHLEKIIL